MNFQDGEEEVQPRARRQRVADPRDAAFQVMIEDLRRGALPIRMETWQQLNQQEVFNRFLLYYLAEEAYPNVVKQRIQDNMLSLENQNPALHSQLASKFAQEGFLFENRVEQVPEQQIPTRQDVLFANILQDLTNSQAPILKETWSGLNDTPELFDRVVEYLETTTESPGHVVQRIQVHLSMQPNPLKENLMNKFNDCGFVFAGTYAPFIQAECLVQNQFAKIKRKYCCSTMLA